MYRIFLDDELFYDPRIPELALTDMTCEMEVNKTGTLKFTIPATHPKKDVPKKMYSVLSLYQDDEWLYSGRVLSDGEDFYGNRTIECEGELSYLLDRQATSYEAQIEHYSDIIGKHAGWKFAGIYADDGISGTNTKKREEFNRLIDDCMAGKIDMVITKSISRFARNTLDCLKYIRQLKDRNIAVYFEKESINTLDAKGEVLLTIMASLAQQESQSISQNVRLGLQYRYQQGKVQVCTNRFLGYDKDKDGNLIINPEEAKIVKRIFREYLEGKSYYAIGKGLTADGIRTAAGNDYWLPSTLRKILRNEKCISETRSCRRP